MSNGRMSCGMAPQVRRTKDAARSKPFRSSCAGWAVPRRAALGKCAEDSRSLASWHLGIWYG